MGLTCPPASCKSLPKCLDRDRSTLQLLGGKGEPSTQQGEALPLAATAELLWKFERHRGNRWWHCAAAVVFFLKTSTIPGCKTGLQAPGTLRRLSRLAIVLSCKNELGELLQHGLVLPVLMQPCCATGMLGKCAPSFARAS